MSIKKKRLYFNILISMTLCIVLTMLILSTFLYINFENIALNQVYSDSMNRITQTSKNVSVITNMALTLSNQIYQDLNVAKLLYYEYPDTYDIRSAMDQLTNYRLTVPYIDSVYVYNGKTGTIYINSVSERNVMREAIQKEANFDDKQIIDILNNFYSYNKSVPIARNFKIYNDEGVQKYYYTFLRYDSLSGKKLDSAVVVNISPDWVCQGISSNLSEKTGEIYVIDAKGKLMCNTKKHSMLTDLSENSFTQRILDNTDKTGYFTDTVNGEESIISYTVADNTGWIYFSVIPKVVLFKEINNMKFTTVLIAVFILLIGFALAVFASRKLYIPIRKIMQRAKLLEEENKNNNEMLRKGFLKDIILGRDTSNKSLLKEELLKLGADFPENGVYRVIVIRIDNYKNFCDNYNAEDRKLYRFGIMNISEEIFLSNYSIDAMDVGRGTLVLLLNMTSENQKQNKLIEKNIKSIQEAVMKYINVSLTFSISNESNSIEHISFLYEQAFEASLYRFFEGCGSMIYFENIRKLKENEYCYPFGKEKLMIDALMSQKSEEAKALFDEIISSTRNFSIDDVNLAISRLVFDINDVLNTMRRNNSVFADFHINLSFGLVDNSETIEDLNAEFYKLFDEISRRLKDRKKAKHEELINGIDNIILKEYSSVNLSIESIAGALDISATYMCKLYKQYTLTTILDKIVAVRMEAARKLLSETQLPVADIAEKAGFTNSSYFYKSFKKINGATPNDYRSKGGG